MLDILKNEKLWCAVAGAAAIVVGKKVLMKLQNDAKATFQNIKDEASDICYDAKTEAGITEEAVAE